MDPTKSFDHLDPKLKDTYARVMGTDTSSSGNPAANATAQPAAAPSPLSVTPDSLSQPQPTVDPTQNPLGSPTLSASPNPIAGVDPSLNAQPAAATPELSQPLETPSPAGATADANAAPSMSSFFSNPSPAATEPSPQAYGENGMVTPASEQPVSPAPVTPYNPTDPSANPNSAPAESFAQPLPSPSTVGQTAPHETSALLKVLYIVGSVIFFAIYTIFWIKVFNIPTPLPF